MQNSAQQLEEIPVFILDHYIEIFNKKHSHKLLDNMLHIKYKLEKFRVDIQKYPNKQLMLETVNFLHTFIMIKIRLYCEQHV